MVKHFVKAGRRSGVFIVNFEHNSYLILVSIVNFEQVNADLDML